MQNSNRHPHGFGIAPLFQGIPDQLKPGHWCVFEAVPRDGKPGKYDKIPHNGLHRLSTTNTKGWLEFVEAVMVYTDNPGRFNGIGRLVEQDGFTFIDVDGVVDYEIYTRSFPTYWERSPSGKGIRGVSLGTVSRDVTEPVEIYAGHKPRFVTFTGHRIGFNALRDVTAPLEAWINQTNAPEVEPDIAPRPAFVDVELPFPLNKRKLDKIPPDCTDRSQAMMSVAVRLLTARIARQDVYCFLAQSLDWSQVALDHRQQDVEKAMDYLWSTVLKADAWVKKNAPQGEFAGYFKREGKPWDPLFAELNAQPPLFNSDHWPPLLRDYAQEIAINTGADPSAPAFAGLWSLSACIDHRSSINVGENWSEPMIFWACLIGSPATMKTPATKPFTAMLGRIEDSMNAQFAQQQEAYERAQARFEAQQREPQDNEVNIEVPRPVRPIALRLMINAGTGQGMRDLLTERPRGCAVFYDEMSDFLQSQTTTGRDNPDRGFWLQGYGGGKHNTQLAGRGYMDVPNIAIPMFGNVQPKVLQPMGKNLKSDGLIQRFVPVPLHPSEAPDFDNQVPTFMSRAGAWEQLLHTYIMRQPFTLKMSSEARDCLKSFVNWAFKFIRAAEQLHWSDGHITAMGKTRGLLVRLAGLFHLIEGRDGDEICLEDMQRAERLLREYIIPAQNHLYNQLFGHGQEPFRLWLVDTIVTHHTDFRISLREIKRLGDNRPELKDGSTRTRNEAVIAAMDSLEGYDIVTQDLEVQHDSRRLVWHVNPELVEALEARIEDRREHHRWILGEIAKLNQSRTKA